MQLKYKGLRISNKHRQPDSTQRSGATHLLACLVASTSRHDSESLVRVTAGGRGNLQVLQRNNIDTKFSIPGPHQLEASSRLHLHQYFATTSSVALISSSSFPVSRDECPASGTMLSVNDFEGFASQTVLSAQAVVAWIAAVRTTKKVCRSSEEHTGQTTSYLPCTTMVGMCRLHAHVNKSGHEQK
jgi:hypothetical protein